MKEYSTYRSEILKRIEKDLKPGRFRHTLGVESTAIALARIAGISEEKASLAALLHDWAKYMSEDASIKLLKRANVLKAFPNLEAYPKLLHAFAGAELVKKEYPKLDDEIVSAVQYHTTGRAGMSTLEKIIFASDYIEPGRKTFSGLSEARERVFADLDQGVFLILEQTIRYLEENGESCYFLTKEAYEDMKRLVKPEEL